jgi:hypothetical protein
MIRNTQLHIILLTSPTSQQWRNTVGGLLRGQVSAPVFLLPGQKGHNGQNPPSWQKQLDICPFQSQYIQYISKKEMHCMTEKQAEAEIRYQLARFLLFRLQKEGILSTEESEQVRQVLCKKYKPFTYSLEVNEPWTNGK